MQTFAEIPQDLLAGVRLAANAVMAPPVEEGAPLMPAPSVVADEEAHVQTTATQGAYQLASLTALRRPLSRWGGSQGSSRSAKAPIGTLFIAAVLADHCEAAGGGA